MKRLTSLTSPWVLTGTLLACLSSLAADAHAQAATVTYDLKDVWLRPDITHPREQAQQMTGTFVWTYTVGKFEEGSGRFLNLNLPWWGTRTSPTLKTTIEPKGIEIVMVGNYHGLGVDVSLRLAPPLSPYQPSPIDTVKSKFDIEVGVSRRGHVTKGSIVPRCAQPKNYGSGTAGSGSFVPIITSSGGDPRLGNASFRIDGVGVTVLVDPKNWFLIPLQATGTTGVPGVGTLRIPTPVPNNPLLVGADFDLQVVAADRGSTGGEASATNGLNVVICR
ncbi:MAG: hypothetical protein ACYST0_12075 [Planctomycetota bacterium]|jgi:hypothetical protein